MGISHYDSERPDEGSQRAKQNHPIGAQVGKRAKRIFQIFRIVTARPLATCDFLNSESRFGFQRVKRLQGVR
jgi:hypothetical protein